MNIPIVKWGNSQAVRIPVAMLELLGMKSGDAFDGRIVDERLVLQPVRRNHDDLDVLLSDVADANIPALCFALSAPVVAAP